MSSKIIKSILYLAELVYHIQPGEEIIITTNVSLSGDESKILRVLTTSQSQSWWIWRVTFNPHLPLDWKACEFTTW